ncbi:Fic family protein [Intestinibaculum porci]|uniref:Fic family protein n=1 Tax=Intestinibaculum porci TaxID=2487118 RepID=UPI0030C77186
MHPLIRSAIFHYEFEFIHPFADGNGRMGRMWHSLLLGTWNEIFYWLPIEELIRSRQQNYYDALGQSDEEADSSYFVEYMLEVILDTLKETTIVGQPHELKNTKVQKLLEILDGEELSAAELMDRLQLSHKPSFRRNYLNPALKLGLIEMTIPEKPKSRNQKYRRK